jgi:hypothetical protein
MCQAPSNKIGGVAGANCDVTTVILVSVISLNRKFKCAYYWEKCYPVTGQHYNSAKEGGEE